MDTLKNYFRTIQAFQDLTRHGIIEGRQVEHVNPRFIKAYRHIFKQLNTCRLYEIDLSRVDALLQYHIRKDLMDAVMEHPDKSESELIAEDLERTIDFIESYDFSTLHLPSKCLYVGFSNSKVIDIKDKALVSIEWNGLIGTLTSIQHLGFLLSKDFYIRVVEVSQEGSGSYLNFSMEYYQGQWGEYSANILDGQAALSLKDSILTASYVIEMINSYQTIVVNYQSDKSYRRNCDRYNKKKIVPNPPAFYRVDLKNLVLSQSEESDKLFRQVIERTYAYQVRGHYRHRITVGDLPIDPKVEKYLKKNTDRKIFYDRETIDQDHWDILTKRRIQVHPNQWVAVLKVWVDEYIANSKDGKNPYIPSIHVAK